ncbi:MAG: zf-HC2 domain-containing protein [Cyclobacteriaceae bacterium]|nr:zf-HC2 domain-containing protein [Cyclobacteriaceae bacterium]
MNCKIINDILLDYIDGSLSDFKSEEVKKHIKVCEECSLKLKQFQQINHELQNIETITAPLGMSQEFAKYIAEEKSNSSRSIISPASKNTVWRVAASVLLFVIGSVFGMNIQNLNMDTSKVSELEKKLETVKQQIALITLQEHSASEKIKVIHSTSQNSVMKKELIFALLEVFQSDNNVNVRLAALDALRPYFYDSQVKTSLIQSLLEQEDPYVQIGLIQLLASMKSYESNQAIQEVLQNGKLRPEVAVIARQLIEKRIL